MIQTTVRVSQRRGVKRLIEPKETIRPRGRAPTRDVYKRQVVDGVGHHMELVVIIGSKALLGQLVELAYRPLVQLHHLLGLDQVLGVKAAQVAQAVPGGVAELQVVLGQLLEDVVGAAHIHVVICLLYTSRCV